MYKRLIRSPVRPSAPFRVQRQFQSTNVTPKRDQSTTIPSNPNKVNFNDAKQSFKSKSLSQLVRAYAVFRVCQVSAVVKRAESLMKLSYRLIGANATNYFMRQTLFGHFCAGETAELIRPTVNYLEKHGVGSILDYASENDVAEEEQPKPEANKAKADESKKAKVPVQCRVYDYKDEAKCDMHMATFEHCIKSVHAVSPTGFAAIKVTALGNPTLLEALSNTIVQFRKLFEEFDKEKTGYVTREQFKAGYEKYFSGGDVEQIFKTFDDDNNNRVDYVEWTNAIAPEDLSALTAHCRSAGPLASATLSEEEKKLVKRMRQRTESLAALAESLGVRIMIDAEHTYFQPAIDNITYNLSKKFNKKYPVVFGTYQMYLKDSKHRLFTDLARAKKGQYKFAAKLVRGAYMVLERERAANLGIEDPIQPSLQATHDNYNGAVREVIGRIAKGDDIEIMIASHNQQSVETALECMNEHKLPPNSGIYFGQLLGMSDHLSFSLGGGGYKAYKYVPFGYVHEVMPYLIRRAQENSGLMSGAPKELSMLSSEIMRRIFRVGN
jgi:proline dehydrogenase